MTTMQGAKAGTVRLVVFAGAAALIFVASVPFGYGPLVVGLAVLGAGFVVRRRDPALARLAQILGAIMTALGLAIVLTSLAASSGPVDKAPPVPQEVPVQRP
ncbi:hypothetical protein [Amycolatopsis aidingensis]|uniref:hypothetical protein n=1 Tax=Amycolatopsis aidingensis TaxID=2842453 RepID=UPI001E2A5084|nr:hypothetical protein [Amycolatopsis aidingensis]